MLLLLFSFDNQIITLRASCLLLRLAPLRVLSTTSYQQPPELVVLGQVDCVGP